MSFDEVRKLSEQLREQTKLHFMYITFLVVVLLAVIVVVNIDTTDKGECKMSVTNEILVRDPGTKTFVERQFCIIVYF